MCPVVSLDSLQGPCSGCLLRTVGSHYIPINGRVKYARSIPRRNVHISSPYYPKDIARELSRKARAHDNILVFSDLSCYPSIKNLPLLHAPFSLRTPAIRTKPGLCLFLKVAGGSLAISSEVPCFSTSLQWPFFDNVPICKFSVLPSGPSKMYLYLSRKNLIVQA